MDRPFVAPIHGVNAAMWRGCCRIGRQAGSHGLFLASMVRQDRVCFLREKCYVSNGGKF